MKIYQDSNGEHWLEFYWEDLTEEAKTDVLKAIGCNGQFDIYPIASIPITRKWVVEYYGKTQ